MWEKLRNFWNRLWNTAMIGPRAIGTGLNTVTDTIDTAIALPKDALDVIKATGHAAKDVLVEARTKWKWYQRVWNIALSPVIAAGTVLEWAVRTAVTPVAHWVVNTWNTVKNTVTNTRRSTFGRIFSKKPLSDFSYDKLKTANFINKDKNRFSRLQFGKKKWVWVETPPTKKSSWKVETAAATTAAATTAAAVWAKEVSDLNAKISKLAEENAKTQKQLNEVLSNYKKLEEENTELKKSIKELVETMKKDKKSSEKPAEVKPEKKEWKWEKKEEKPAEVKPEKKDDKWEKAEGKEGKEGKETKETKEVKDADRVLELVESDTWKSVVKYLMKKHPDIKIKFNDSESTWHIHLGDESEELKIWTKIATQIPIIILHEWAHTLIYDKIDWTKDLIDFMENLNQKYGKQLFSISNNKKYDTKKQKTIEDVCETIALYAKDDWSFDKHMKKLQSGENDKLAKITTADAEKLKELCKTIISKIDAENKTVKMYDETPVSKAA